MMGDDWVRWGIMGSVTNYKNGMRWGAMGSVVKIVSAIIGIVLEPFDVQLGA
jgi:hypothetical protein